MWGVGGATLSLVVGFAEVGVEEPEKAPVLPTRRSGLVGDNARAEGNADSALGAIVPVIRPPQKS
jgi:hypothetical protein